MRVLQIGADRSKRGILARGSAAYRRQRAYAERFGRLDIIALSRARDSFRKIAEGPLRVIPTSSTSKWWYGFDACAIARSLERPDVVSAQDPFETGLISLLVARRFAAPFHVQVHTDFLDPAYARHSLINRLRIPIARFVLSRAAGIRVVSARIKNSLHAAGYRLRVDPVVLPIYADIGSIKTSHPSPELAARFARWRQKLLVVARLEREKNVALAIRAFAKAPRRDACLIVVGEGSERAPLERLAAELGVGERVLFEGSAEAAPYYRLADLVLVTSAYEGYGLVIVEALAAGTPVLSTDVGVAREAGAIVACPGRFAEALERWFEEGPRQGELKLKTYPSFEEYARAYCDDVAAIAAGGYNAAP